MAAKQLELAFPAEEGSRARVPALASNHQRACILDAEQEVVYEEIAYHPAYARAILSGGRNIFEVCHEINESWNQEDVHTIEFVVQKNRKCWRVKCVWHGTRLNGLSHREFTQISDEAYQAMTNAGRYVDSHEYRQHIEAQLQKEKRFNRQGYTEFMQTVPKNISSSEEMCPKCGKGTIQKRSGFNPPKSEYLICSSAPTCSWSMGPQKKSVSRKSRRARRTKK